VLDYVRDWDRLFTDFFRLLRAPGHLILSGSRTVLPPSRPLRTVRESFPSYGSSLSFAPWRTRLFNGQFPAVDLMMTVGMQ
jgi:hypothetical protein